MKAYSEWVELKKSHKNPTTKKRDKFIDSLNKLFDIGRSDAEELMKVEVDILFYRSMKADRVASMAAVDRKWVKKEESKLKRL